MMDSDSRRDGVTAAIISTDVEFSGALGAQLRDAGVTVAAEIAVPYTEIADSDLARLREVRPDVVFLDLETDPQVGLKFACFLGDSGMAGSLVGAGQTESSNLLLAAMRAGITEFLAKPADPESVESVLDGILRKSGKKAADVERTPGRVISVFSGKGGSGSTTVATNLAIEIHRLTRKRTLVVDLDLELGETALQLGIEPRFSIGDLVRNFHRVDSELLASYIERHETGVELLSAPYEPGRTETDSPERIRQILKFLRNNYDYVIIDAPKSFTPATTAALEEADELYMIATADIPSLRNVTRCLQLVRAFGKRKDDDWIRLLLNRHDPHDTITRAEIEEAVGLPVFGTLQNDFKAVMTSINAGRPVVAAGKSAFGRDIRSLAGKITGVEHHESAGGFLSGLLGGRRNGSRHERANSKAKMNGKSNRKMEGVSSDV